MATRKRSVAKGRLPSEPPSDRLAALERRMEWLERGLRRQGSKRGRAGSDAELALVEQLRAAARRSHEAVAGSVVYAGAARIGDEEYLYTRQHAVAELLARDAGKTARALASLGNPARLLLARELLAAPRSSQELQALLGDGTTGQLYHHLREMQVAGLLVQPARGTYRLAPHAAVPLLAILAAADDLVGAEVEP